MEEGTSNAANAQVKNEGEVVAATKDQEKNTIAENQQRNTDNVVEGHGDCQNTEGYEEDDDDYYYKDGYYKDMSMTLSNFDCLTGTDGEPSVETVTEKQAHEQTNAGTSNPCMDKGKGKKATGAFELGRPSDPRDRVAPKGPAAKVPRLRRQEILLVILQIKMGGFLSAILEIVGLQEINGNGWTQSTRAAKTKVSEDLKLMGPVKASCRFLISFGVPPAPTPTTAALSIASQTHAPSLSLQGRQFSLTVYGPTASSLVPTQTHFPRYGAAQTGCSVAPKQSKTLVLNSSAGYSRGKRGVPAGVALLTLGPGTPYPSGIALPPVDGHVIIILGGPHLSRSTRNAQKRYLKEVEEGEMSELVWSLA
uniref:Uncharacterized protein n=1 Tax=Cannabis sativa TaxID=3483 RepID=A0A803QIJ3_CANSA